MSTKKAAPLPRPAVRYWKGKAPKGVTETQSDSEEEEDEQPEFDEGDVGISGDQDILDIPGNDEDIRGNKAVKSMNVSLKDVNISRDGKVIVGGREESGRTAVEVEDEDEDGELSLAYLQDLRLIICTESEEEASEEDSKPAVPGAPSDEEVRLVNMLIIII